MRTKTWAFLAAVGVVVVTAPAFAHHSFAADYDANKPVKVTGVVTKVEWTNPHAHYYIDVKDAQGNVTNWNFELATINVLARNGWTSKALKVGDEVTVEGFKGKVVDTRAAASSFVLPSGKKLFAGSANADEAAGR
jgi:DNA/RNA endonuclease YhcR with UshA esterase domain